MGDMVMRYELRKRVVRPLLAHYTGAHRPPHARPHPRQGVPAVAGTGTADDVARQARAAAKRHKAFRLRGTAPGPLVDVLFAGPPPHYSRDAWPVERTYQWVQATRDWLEGKMAVASPGAKLVGFWLHMDERSPHIHACLIPELPNGELGWGKLQCGMGEHRQATTDRVKKRELADAMSLLQDDYWERVASGFGLGRGQRGSKRKHHRPIHDHGQGQGHGQEVGQGQGQGRGQA